MANRTLEDTLQSLREQGREEIYIRPAWDHEHICVKTPEGKRMRRVTCRYVVSDGPRTLGRAQMDYAVLERRYFPTEGQHVGAPGRYIPWAKSERGVINPH